MGKPELSSVVMGSMKKMGYLAPGGDSSMPSPKLDNRLIGHGAMGNDGALDPNRAKPSSMNPGVDKGFLDGQSKAQKDTTGHGMLGINCKLTK